MIGIIARREATALFRTPIAWILLCAVQFVLAYQFLAKIEIYVELEDKLRAMPEPPGITEVIVTPTFGTAALLMLFLIPMVTMSSLSGERTRGTLKLLFSSPVTTRQIVLGKYCGVMLLVGIIWLLTCLMPLTLLWGGAIDVGLFLAGALGLAAIVASYTAVGVMASAFFSQAAAAAVTAFGSLTVLWMVDWAAQLGESDGLFSYLSSLNHFRHLANGLIDTTDLAYFVLLSVGALVLAIWRLDLERRAH